MIEEKDAKDLLTILAQSSFKGSELERALEIKQKLIKIIQDAQTPKLKRVEDDASAN